MKRALAERAKAQRVEENRAAVPLSTPSIPTHASNGKNAGVGTGVSIGVGVNSKVGMNISPSALKPPRKTPRTKPPRSSPSKLTATPAPPPQSMPPVKRGVGKRSRPSKNTAVPQINTPVESSTAQDKAFHAAGESVIAKVVKQGPSIKTDVTERKILTPSSIETRTRTKSPTNTSIKRRNGPGSESPSKRPRKSPSGKNNLHKNTSSSNNTTPSTLPLHPIYSDDETTHNAASGGDQQSSNGAFYLKHQNRALTAELHMFKHSVRALEAEREVRRRECLSIGEALRRLEGFWREMEVAVLKGLMQWKLKDLGPPTECKPTKESLNIAPASTGMGKDVETLTTILDALTNLAHSSILPLTSKPSTCDTTLSSSFERDEVATTEESPGLKHEELGDIDSEERKDMEENYELYLKLLSDATTCFSDRCCQFQQLLLRLIQQMWTTSTPVHRDEDISDQQRQREEEVFGATSLHKQIATLQTNCSKLENQVKELVKSRDDAILLERRVRKGLYRLASGRMKIEEVLKTVEKEGSSTLDFPDNEDKALPSTTESSSVKDAAIPGADVAVTIKLDEETLGVEDILKMKKQIDDLGLIAELREKQIMELLKEKESCEKRINELLTKDTDLEEKRGDSICDDDVKLSPLYIGISSKFSAADREVQSLKKELASVKNRWSVTKGDLELARKNVTDLTEKHFRRLKELAGEPSGDSTDDLYQNTSAIITNGDKQHIQNVKKFTELEHKLKHALDNVRQAEAIRTSLTESNLMNEELQNKLEELRAKNSSLLATKARAKSAEPKETSTPRESSSSEKIRSMKKQLSAAMNSKDLAKGKQERAEKERDILMKTNARLIKQIQEKDDMNAKSLSTILHLKQLSEQLVEQKNILEKKLKGTQQLDIAARLAANAKERVEEEATRERETYQDEVKLVKLSLESSIKEKENFCRLYTESKAKVITVTEKLSMMRKRCDELAMSSTNNEKEKKNLNEALAIAKREAEGATKRAKREVVDSTSPSVRTKGSKFENNFSNEDLSKLVRVLKDRLMCPVCNTRDKEVILLRCRHMFCKQCVDTNIKNRSRKCPACAQRFDMKDVEDVWL